MKTQAITKKGQNTKQKIIDVSKELFFKQGLIKTTVAQITKESEVNNGLFTYYFGTKTKLANMISTEFRVKLRNAVSKKMFEDFKEYNLALGIAVEQRMNIKLQHEYPALLRFSIETYSENASPINMNFTNYPIKDGQKEANVKRDHYYKLQKRLINPTISDLDLKFYQITGIAITNSIMRSFHQNDIVCSTDYIGDKLIKTLFYLLGVEDKDYIYYLQTRSKEIVDQLDFKIVPYFELEY
jgi:AcrR family transcriptional regulator